MRRRPHAHARTPRCTRAHPRAHHPGIPWTRLLPVPTLLAEVSQLKPRGSSSQSLLIRRPAPEGRQAGEQGGDPAEGGVRQCPQDSPVAAPVWGEKNFLTWSTLFPAAAQTADLIFNSMVLSRVGFF